MLNDEQILLKTANLLENFDISNKKPEKLLREITEDELEVIQDVLDDLKGENLAFNDLFAGKMRKVIDFPTLDVGSDLGKFVDAFKVQEYDVDWDKGIVSGEKELDELSNEDRLARLLGPGRGGEAPPGPKKRKIQMKIGKFFAKIADLASKRDVIAQKVIDHVKKTDRYANPIRHASQLTGTQIEAALNEEEQKRLRQLFDQLNMYIPNPGRISGNTADWATKMAKYWQTNAGYIKKEIKNLKNDKYSMIITRYPIDVMRMADFENITSCHSPPSRGQTDTSYYKCAVAEAKGHGAVAYVVETEDLLHMTNTSNIESAEQEIQEGEVFVDKTRNLAGATSWSPTGRPIGELLSPISRIRLRQMRYYDTDQPKRWDEGTELAVPETREYGARIPGISDRITAWAKENQEKVIENMPKDEDDPEAINLNRFWMFGGSYEDTSGASGRKKLLSRLIGKPELDLIGYVRQNEDTENNIDVNLLGSLEAQWEAEIENITEEWNNRYAVTVVQAWVDDDGGGGLSIQAKWDVVLDWDMAEFIKLPNSYPPSVHAAMHINEYYGDIFDINEAFLNKTKIDGVGKVRWGCRVNLEHPDVLNEEYFYDPDGLNEACQKIDTNIDDKRDVFKHALEEFFKQNMWMEGGEYIKLAREIEDGPFESYEWDVRYDREHPTESYEATAAISHSFNPEALGLDPRVLFDLLDSRDWRLAVRTRLLKSAQIALDTQYHLDIENSQAVVPPTGQDIKYTLTFRITSDDPDERVKLFRELTTGEDSDMDDEDNLKAAFDSTMAHFINARQPSHTQQNLDEHLVRTWKGFLNR